MGQKLVWAGKPFGNWAQAANWSPQAEPQPGDTALVETSIAAVAGLLLDQLDITIGSTDTGVAAGLQILDTTTLSASSTINALPGGSAKLLVPGTFVVDGTIDAAGAAAQPGTLTITGTGQVQIGAAGQFNITALERVDLSTSLTNAGSISVSAGGVLVAHSAIVNTGSFAVTGGSVYQYGGITNNGTITIETGVFGGAGAIDGAGTIQLSGGSQFYANDPVSSGQQIALLDQSEWLAVSYPALLSATISQMQAGDVIDLFNTKADAANGSKRGPDSL